MLGAVSQPRAQVFCFGKPAQAEQLDGGLKIAHTLEIITGKAS